MVKDTKKVNTDGVNLLVGIMIAYPEVGKVYYEPNDESLNIIFIIKDVVDDADFKKFKAELKESLSVYYKLEQLSQVEMKIEKEICGTFTFVQITRDVLTLSKGELNLLGELFKAHFKERLADEGKITVFDDDMVLQDEFIDNMLNNLSVNKMEVKLIGIREEGRVMIFNK